MRDVRRLEDAGAAAIVLHSLFEEQITEAESAIAATMKEGAEISAFEQKVANERPWI